MAIVTTETRSGRIINILLTSGICRFQRVQSVAAFDERSLQLHQIRVTGCHSQRLSGSKPVRARRPKFSSIILITGSRVCADDNRRPTFSFSATSFSSRSRSFNFDSSLLSVFVSVDEDTSGCFSETSFSRTSSGSFGFPPEIGLLLTSSSAFLSNDSSRLSDTCSCRSVSKSGLPASSGMASDRCGTTSWTDVDGRFLVAISITSWSPSVVFKTSEACESPRALENVGYLLPWLLQTRHHLQQRILQDLCQRADFWQGFKLRHTLRVTAQLVLQCLSVGHRDTYIPIHYTLQPGVGFVQELFVGVNIVATLLFVGDPLKQSLPRPLFPFLAADAFPLAGRRALSAETLQAALAAPRVTEILQSSGVLLDLEKQPISRSRTRHRRTMRIHGQKGV
ncbi:hypothetical protein WN55_01594 [Dufourea novaeangliae]|uniref:Uncharacterized protein n=1 Tax=Dufourea novaeangliae TaxID=178035 RepID=A0A154PGA5_DUFNO|nr:hypothetical protein WN55_01594 [Dufourea novaeangliae]